MTDISLVLKTGTTPFVAGSSRKIPVGNFGDYFNFTIQDSAGSVLPITGKTPKFTLYRVGPLREWVQAMQLECAIVSGAGGTCRYLVANGDFTNRTDYMARIELFTGTTKIDSTEDFLLSVV